VKEGTIFWISSHCCGTQVTVVMVSQNQSPTRLLAVTVAVMTMTIVMMTTTKRTMTKRMNPRIAQRPPKRALSQKGPEAAADLAVQADPAAEAEAAAALIGGGVAALLLLAEAVRGGEADRCRVTFLGGERLLR